MSNGRNTGRIRYTTDHTDDLTTLNCGEATLTAFTFCFLPCAFLEWELKLFLKSIAGMSKGSFSISQELLILLTKWKGERKKTLQNSKAHFKSLISSQKKYHRRQ